MSYGKEARKLVLAKTPYDVTFPCIWGCKISKVTFLDCLEPEGIILAPESKSYHIFVLIIQKQIVGLTFIL